MASASAFSPASLAESVKRLSPWVTTTGFSSGAATCSRDRGPGLVGAEPTQVDPGDRDPLRDLVLLGGVVRTHANGAHQEQDDQHGNGDEGFLSHL